MTTVKPPSAGTPTDGVSRTSLEPDVRGPAAARGAAEPAAAEGPAGPQDATPAAEAGSLDALVADLQAGRIAPDELADALVSRAMADVSQSLSADQLAALEATLRAALEQDPTLQSLRGTWGR